MCRLYWVKLIQEEEAICRTSPQGFRLVKRTLLVAVIPVCLRCGKFPLVERWRRRMENPVGHNIVISLNSEEFAQRSETAKRHDICHMKPEDKKQNKKKEKGRTRESKKGMEEERKRGLCRRGEKSNVVEIVFGEVQYH